MGADDLRHATEYDVVVTVNPRAILTSTLTPPAICNNTEFDYTPTSSTTEATFSWSRALVTGISNAASSGTGAVAETLVNTTTEPIQVTYVYTVGVADCDNATEYDVVVTVNPTAVLTSTLTPPSICNNTEFDYTPTSSTTEATFSWSRALVTGISNVAVNGTGAIAETLVNTTTEPIQVTYVYKVSADGCDNATEYDVVVTVNPTAVLTSTLTPPAICNNTEFDYTPTSSTTEATFSWSRALVTGISNAASSGTGAVAETLINTTTEPIQVTYVYKVSADDCDNATEYDVVVTVNPTAVLTSTLTPPAICNNTEFDYTPTSSTTEATFSWSRALVTGISNAASSGTGAVAETLINTTTEPIQVIYVYTVGIAGCDNPATYSVVVTVNPEAILTSTLTPPAICNNTEFDYTPTSSTTEATFSWSRALVTGISNAASSGTGAVAETLINTTTEPIQVTYVYKVSADDCDNATEYDVVVTVNPTAVLTSTLTPAAICNNTEFDYTPTSSTTEATFSWSRALVTGISNAASSGTGAVAETLINTTTEPIQVTYVYKVSADDCDNATEYDVVVTVNPTAVLTSTLTPPAICNNTEFDYTPTSSTTEATFSWSRALVTGISNTAVKWNRSGCRNTDQYNNRTDPGYLCL